MKFVITGDAKKISKQQADLDKRSKTFKQDAHTQALSCLMHAVLHNRVEPMNALVSIMGHSMPAMNKWAVKYGPFKWQGTDKATGREAGLVIVKDKREAMLAKRDEDKAAFDTWLTSDEVKPYWEELKAKNEMPGINLAKLIVAAYQKAEKAKDDPELAAKSDLRGLEMIAGIVPELQKLMVKDGAGNKHLN